MAFDGYAGDGQMRSYLKGPIVVMLMCACGLATAEELSFL
jgi:hypothetical protein